MLQNLCAECRVLRLLLDKRWPWLPPRYSRSFATFLYLPNCHYLYVYLQVCLSLSSHFFPSFFLPLWQILTFCFLIHGTGWRVQRGNIDGNKNGKQITVVSHCAFRHHDNLAVFTTAFCEHFLNKHSEVTRTLSQHPINRSVRDRHRLWRHM